MASNVELEVKFIAKFLSIIDKDDIKPQGPFIIVEALIEICFSLQLCL